MRKMNACLFVLFLTIWPLGQEAGDWEWQVAMGPWTLEPWTSPVQRQAEQIVSNEVRRLMAPLLSEFTIVAFEPRVDMRSRGFFLSAGCWRLLGGGRFALGVSASYLDFSLPFTLKDERVIYFQSIPIAHISTSGEGRINLRTLMFAAMGRWRAFQANRTAVYSGLGLTLLRFSGDLLLPLTASVQSSLGRVELSKIEDKTLAELRAETAGIPSWILSPALSASLHYRLGAKSRLFIEICLSQGTFLAAGISFGN